MKLIVYIRVSKDYQTERSNGLESQLEQCKIFAEKLGMPIHEVFKDEGISGAIHFQNRPGLNDAISCLKKGDILLVARRDRLARGEPLAFIEYAIKNRKAKLASAADEGTNGSQDDPTAYMMRAMTDVFSEFERKLIGWRTKNALQAKIARGERCGHIPYGYRVAADGIHLEENPEEQEIINQIKEMRSRKYPISVRKIAKRLNEQGILNRNKKWDHNTVYNRVKKVA
ncbi:MAG TPA: recombinase family protein [Flavobacterium sp.]|uniref:recombinase family protein n=1 Tax=Flavobacterium sp. TaxID=239 RepID=UPI002ED35CDA